MTLQRASEDLKDAQETFDRIQFEVIRDGMRFFERLVLLCGGAIVLSITFIGYLNSRENFEVVFLPFLHAAWGFLLVGLVLSLLRNRFQTHYTYFSTFSYFAREQADFEKTKGYGIEAGQVALVVEETKRLSKVVALEDTQKAEKVWRKVEVRDKKRADSFWRLLKGCEYGASIGFFVGFLLMVFFAVGNTL